MTPTDTIGDLATIHCGDCRSVLASLPERSVQCCITSPPSDFEGSDADAVQSLALKEQTLALLNVIIGECEIGNATRRAMTVREIAITDHLGSVLRSVLLKIAKGQNGFSLLTLDSEKRKQDSNDVLGFEITDLPSEERSSATKCRLLLIVPSSKRVAKEFDGIKVYHLHLKACMVPSGGAALASVSLGLLDPDAALAVDQTGTVGDVDVFHAILRTGGCVIIHSGGVRKCLLKTFRRGKSCSTSSAETRAKPSGRWRRDRCNVASRARRTFGLRDYGTGEWEGGDASCEHKVRENAAVASSTLGGGKATTGHQREGYRSECRRCGAVRIDRQIGLEPTPDAYVAELVAVFREVRRVLADDGTLWLNLGDSYYANGWECHRINKVGNGSVESDKRKSGVAKGIAGLKPKDLIGIPWRVAFALQADGWYLRQDVIWAKPNPMPESVTDRCTKAHEYLFLLSKSERYWYDAEAIAEKATTDPHSPGWSTKRPTDKGPMLRQKADGTSASQWDEPNRTWGSNDTRNRRSVWTITTEPFPGAHFAVMPTALVEPCILAGSREGDIVLDPFGGSGTVPVVVVRKGRRAVMVELNPEYVAMARRRIEHAAGNSKDQLFSVLESGT